MKKTASYAPPSPLALAMEHHRAGRLEQAEALYRKLDGKAEALHLLALLYQQGARHADAIDALQRAIDKEPGRAPYYVALDASYRALDLLPALQASYARLLQGQPDNIEAHLLLGHALRDDGRLPDALSSYLAVLALQPEHAEAYSNLGDTLKLMGNLDEAQVCYVKALELQPGFAEVHNNLGSLYQQQEQWALSAGHFDAALALRPDLAAAHYNLGVTRQHQGLLDEAVACYRRALALDPRLPQPYNNMGIALKELGRLDDAVAAYQAALALAPDFAEALNNLGGALLDQQQVGPAIECFQHAVTVRPGYAEAYCNLGVAYKADYRLEEALVCFENAVYLKPEYADPYAMLALTNADLQRHVQALHWCEKTLAMWPDSAAAHFNLGVAFANMDRTVEAIASFEQAIARKPEFADAWNNLGVAFKERGRFDEAVAAFEKAISLRDSFAEAYNNLGSALKDQGKPDASRQMYERAIAIAPNYAAAHNNLLLSMQYAAGITEQQLFELHLRFAAQFEPSLAAERFVHAPGRDPAKRLKIGYVSPDFRRHAVAFFIEPILARHDKAQVEVFCYYSHVINDQFTARIQADADHWIPCRNMSDQQLAERIHADGIDILVDLAGHTSGNRLLAFARKPAPVQLTYIGYPSTTGLTSMDYRLTDAWAEPPGQSEHVNVETLWRLPEVFCCYAAHANSPAVIDHPPCQDNGYLTFGCFNNYAKVSDPTIVLWAAILAQVPESRLMLEILGLDNPGMRDGVEQRFARLGIDPARLVLIANDRKNQFVLYNRIDIALDPFPCNGGTTSFDTLWMGVPFVTLAGSNFISRLGVTILHNGGLDELIGEDEAAYVAIAVDIARDPARLRRLRDGLRERTRASALMDMARFTHHLEDAYRGMWAKWCNSGCDSGEGVQA
ncbi:tetratricopeptide repeat protein [Massilia sp. CCM 8734]|uniref:tetratricopeptide repeat protein n=1 Tax=Massilia sp. CCM 8734 TaxID=2609283 RepID=UPI00141EAA51|nr:tetratricopeptide repeat protein [Massilia sp. CCM 8734]NHZ99229.1 tetratricopeptide repeat protein [Massilia sp. CCM 8734]